MSGIEALDQFIAEAGGLATVLLLTFAQPTDEHRTTVTLRTWPGVQRVECQHLAVTLLFDGKAARLSCPVIDMDRLLARKLFDERAVEEARR